MTASRQQWVDIKGPQAIYDEDTGRLVSEAVHTVRRHPASSDRAAGRSSDPPRRPAQIPGRGGLVPHHRYHAAFIDSRLALVRAEAQHRNHAIIEQINADPIAGPLVRLPSVGSSRTTPG
ncbi:hypothetical protein [Actinoplanes auranticolor]|uniref:Uncharacterized protein n=1 Tax=Actinoplanes auranticolor TaxID=47988 RepID=A0A919SUC0_9ACTN|nr:hypothetical protein [Actinoplanes auranticolor]GIM79080.1 hypothetical protein Aau02nite_84010 [Actinoplanes auranticolor]